MDKQQMIYNELKGITEHEMYNGWNHKTTPNGYHSFNIGSINIKGQRNPRKRLNEFKKYFDFTDKVVLDLGCCVGGMLLHLETINYGIGVDYDEKTLLAARRISQILEIDNVSFVQHDFNKDDIASLASKIKITPDIIFLLSIGAWINRWNDLYTFALSYNCPIFLETNNDEQGVGQLDFFDKNNRKVKLIIEKSLDDITGNHLRKTYFIT